MNEEPIEFPEDVARLRAVLLTQNVYKSDAEIVDAWTKYSESVDANWICLPAEDDAIVEMLRPFLPGIDYKSMDLAMKAFGYHGICPEGLTALRESINEWGLASAAATAGLPPHVLRGAYERVMDDMRAMFAPVDSRGAA